MNMPWRDGNEFVLLENGEEYFPRVMEAINQAKTEILLETFILFDDKVGRELRAVLIKAANRGVHIDMTVDGYGSDTLSTDFIRGLTQSGVRFHVFDPRPRILGVRTNLFRRMHRKILVVDGQLGFIGGINFSADHLLDFGPMAKQDYAVEIRGPLVADIADFARKAILATRPPRWRRRRLPKEIPPVGDATARLVIRDNEDHRNDIENAYRVAIRAAREDILIANAYFFPGYRLLRDLIKAARRGVRVRLVLQGQPDMRIAQFAARMLYEYLDANGVSVYEYGARPLHGKVACVDGRWSTVGSSNLDPFSLALNLEANVLIHDREFGRTLCAELDSLISEHCRMITNPSKTGKRLRRLWVSVVVFHILRRFPAWAGSLPAHKPELHSILPGDLQDTGNQETA